MQYKKYFLLGVLIVGAIFFYFFSSNESKNDTLSNVQPLQNLADETTNATATNQPTQSNTNTISATTPSATLVVDVKGAVKKPGIYELSPEDRVYDAIMASGGYKEQADSKMINHAEKLKDEMVIYVPKKGEKMEGSIVNAIPSAAQSNENAVSSEQALININVADSAALQTISGIGPAKAEAIIQFRTENGPFQSIDDLKKISGFGEKTVERLKPLVTIN
ncbi:helix-hairpin-helix domain-containing protein [Kurthia senegalensis]|uniref:helix-hairpin-helix domain-containing protein n=1 Tax=Kurthia senegalensis TaxID=1033740 RepID=UPI000289F6F4|nr:helix-hairpin-helix domain-containing protein [Kurthia senegalensis]